MEKEIQIWIEGCRQGERGAQLKLYERYAPMLYASCYRILAHVEEAEEAMQDSFLKILTHLDHYHEGMNLEAWMRRVAIHTAIDYVRKRSEELELLTDWGVDMIQGFYFSPPVSCEKLLELLGKEKAKLCPRR